MLPWSAAAAIRDRPSHALDGANRILRSAIAIVGLALLGLFLARAPITWAMALLVGIIGGVLLLIRPAIGLYALAIAIPFGSVRTLSVGGVNLSLAQPILALTLAAMVAPLLAYRRSTALRSGVTMATMGLVGALALSLLPASDLRAAGTELLKWIEFALLLACAAITIREQESRWLVAALLLAGMAEGLLGIYQFLRQVGPPGFVLFGRYMRAYGTFAQPNPYGGYLGMLLPLACAILLTRWGRRGPGRLRSLWGDRVLWLLSLASFATMFAGLIMSWSRGALLGALAGLALVLLALARRAWPVLLMLALVAAVLAPLWSPLVPGDYLSRLDDTTAYLGQDLALVEIDDANFAVIERLAHWEAAWRMFSRSPWIGVGIGQYPVVYPTVSLARWQDPLGHAHNYYLHMLAEAGILGLLAYLGLLIAALSRAWRQARHAEGWPRVLGLAALGMLGHLITHSLVDNLYVQDMYLLVALVLGMLLSGPSPKQSEAVGTGGCEQCQYRSEVA